ncbi:hypothetical protein K461DRAFT_279198 [Myriangium duriaei CBS 260.36]|uniref:Uncharacterized protein n=1 Tax=Myriangium duriaei CBS 260.36 TaxID=1168546 RepID=A0A9P4MG25_9PEZI|nr:hypothetical protein K461DRAFT_279198 [Myriangium duriaei CBS 260.36]
MRTSTSLSGLGTLAAVFSAFAATTQAYKFTSLPSPNLDLSALGRVAVVGDFDSISVAQYKEQSQNGFSTNGSQALLAQYPDGAFASLAASDGNIQTMCPFVMKDGSLAGVVVGGNFTSLGGVQAQGAALFNPNTSQITPLPGLSGSISSIYCDAQSSTVYFGGSFSGGNSTNAIAWVTGWTNLPFAGFNGPVHSVTKAPNGNIVFAGNFDGLGNTTTPQERNDQAINIGSATLNAGSTSTTEGFTSPSNIVCKDFTQQGTGQTWLLSDNSIGYWDAKFRFGFNPTMLRLWNTNYQGRGTKTFRMTALPLNGIMNLTYTDSSGEQQYCDARCPLPQGNTTAQEFTLVNSVGMNEVRIDILEWYGAGGGLNGIELLEDDLYSYAIADFNEPQCTGSSIAANATSSGPWRETPSGQSSSDYLTAYINSGSINHTSAEVVFTPEIKQSGNYSITMYTPGCIQDNSCSTRGSANVTGQVSSNGPTVNTIVTQTNDYDKYDQIFYGYVDVTSSSFRPSITLSPMAGQNVPLTLVAQRIRFELVNSTGGLNGLFEYNPNKATVDLDFSSSAIDHAGMDLNAHATVNTLAVVGQDLYVGGNFTSGGTVSGLSNILSVGADNATALANSGLNNAVETIYQNGSTLYVGGNFTSTGDNKIQGLNGIAIYTTASKAWQPIGAGVDGTVSAIVPLQVNVTAGNLQDAIAISGTFSTVNAFGQNASFAAGGIAIWVLNPGNWLHNLQGGKSSLQGRLTAETNVPNNSPLYAGAVSSQQMATTDAVAMAGNGLPNLIPLGSTVDRSVSNDSLKADALLAGGSSGVLTGLFLEQNNLNLTAIGGHFTANASDGSVINNFAVITGGTNGRVTGLPSTVSANSTILAMDTKDTILFIGGQISGTAGSNDVGGFLVYDLSANQLAGTQPPALSGQSAVVNSVVVQPSSSNVFVGGNFSQAGSLSCGTLCMWNSQANQWMPPGTGLSGIVNTMVWASNNKLVMAGNLTASGNKTTILNYDAKAQTFSTFPGADGLPGPVTDLTPATSDYNQFWATGTAANGSSYLQRYDGKTWTAVEGLGSSTIRSVQIVSTTASHGSSPLIDDSELLLITGAINVPGFGNASAVLFNGTTFQPFLLSSTSTNGQGSVAKIFVQNPANFMSSSGHHLARGFVVLIALAIALALIFLLVVIGILMERYRRRKEGYAPVKQLSPDQQANLGRIPPERLFGSIGEKGGSTPPKL